MYMLFEKYLTSSNQDTIRHEPYRPLFESTFFSTLKYPYGLTRIVHLEQFNQSLSKKV